MRTARTSATQPPPPPAPARAAPPSLERFGDVVARTRAGAPQPATVPTTGIAPVRGPQRAESPLTEAGRQLLARVARGEHYVEGIVRQAMHGRAFTPADLLVMQARVYRYTQELELVAKLVERGTGTVKTILQQGG